jgi:hypothetical protein
MVSNPQKVSFPTNDPSIIDRAVSEIGSLIEVFFLQNLFFKEFFRTDEPRVSGKSREALIGRIAIPGRTERKGFAKVSDPIIRENQRTDKPVNRSRRSRRDRAEKSGEAGCRSCVSVSCQQPKGVQSGQQELTTLPSPPGADRAGTGQILETRTLESVPSLITLSKNFFEELSINSLSFFGLSRYI